MIDYKTTKAKEDIVNRRDSLIDMFLLNAVCSDYKNKVSFKESGNAKRWEHHEITLNTDVKDIIVPRRDYYHRNDTPVLTEHRKAILNRLQKQTITTPRIADTIRLSRLSTREGGGVYSGFASGNLGDASIEALFDLIQYVDLMQYLFYNTHKSILVYGIMPYEVHLEYTTPENKDFMFVPNGDMDIDSELGLYRFRVAITAPEYLITLNSLARLISADTSSNITMKNKAVFELIRRATDKYMAHNPIYSSNVISDGVYNSFISSQTKEEATQSFGRLLGRKVQSCQLSNANTQNKTYHELYFEIVFRAKANWKSCIYRNLNSVEQQSKRFHERDRELEAKHQMYRNNIALADELLKTKTKRKQL